MAHHFGKLAFSLALLASAGAQAQSTVTLYGRIDLAYFHQNGGNSNINSANNRTTAAGVPFGGSSNEIRNGSAGRVGFRGTENLGGGLSANFQMEMRFDGDTGLAHSTFFEARSFVELASTTYGAVYLGREYLPAFWPMLRLDPWGLDTVGTNGQKHMFAQYTVDGGIRSNNTIGYKTPSFSGLTVQVAQSAGEKLRSDSTGGNVEYRNGPIYAGAAFDRITDRDKLALVGGAYDFGLVRPAVLFTQATVAGVKRKNTMLAATAPVGPGLLKFAVSRLDPAGANNNTSRLGVGYEYFLSKRTSLYADLGSSKQQGFAGGVPYSRTTAYDLGLKHNF